MKSLFPENMAASSTLSLEVIASKLLWFEEMLHLVHWQTNGYAEHVAVGNAYDYLHGFRDDIIEKLMGYTGRKPTGFKVDNVASSSAISIASDVMSFATSLKQFGEANGYHDICNMADDLSGNFAKLKYLLTLS